jgi:DnaJ-class molecular chaperone
VCRAPGARAQRTLVVTIPPGAGDGRGLRLRGEGDAASRRRHPPRGLRVAPDLTFARDGDDLLADLAVTPAQAAAGAVVALST